MYSMSGGVIRRVSYRSYRQIDRRCGRSGGEGRGQEKESGREMERTLSKSKIPNITATLHAFNGPTAPTPVIYQRPDLPSFESGARRSARLRAPIAGLFRSTARPPCCSRRKLIKCVDNRWKVPATPSRSAGPGDRS